MHSTQLEKFVNNFDDLNSMEQQFILDWAELRAAAAKKAKPALRLISGGLNDAGAVQLRSNTR